MEKITLTELRGKFPEITRRAAGGSSFELVSHGKPIGVVIAAKSLVEDKNEAPSDA